MFVELTLCVILIAVAFVAAWFYAQAQAERRIVASQADLLDAIRSELKDWQNKALSRSGASPLGHETRPRREKSEKESVIAPTVVHRATLEARAFQQYQTDEERRADEAVRIGQPTIHADKVSYHRVARQEQRDEILEKAGKILSQTPATE